MEGYVIDFEERPEYEAAAHLLMALAFPEAHSPTLDQRYMELCALVIRRWAVHRRGWADGYTSIKPLHVLVETDRIDRMERTLTEVLTKRLWAGRWAFPFVQDALASTPKLPTNVSKLSLNAVAEIVAEAANVSSPNNLMSRWVRPSYPVMPLCVALAVSGALPLPRSDPNFALVDSIIQSREAIEAFVRLAEGLEPVLLSSKKLNLASEKLIRLRLAA